MNSKLRDLRRSMKKHGLQAYLVPSADPHQSEYVPEFWKRRRFISGFSGSAGDVLVTLRKAGLWTDSRYFLQAERELEGSGLSLFRWGLPGVPSWQEWIPKELRTGQTLGVNPQLISFRDYLKLEKEFAQRNTSIKAVEKNLVDEVWRERPAPPFGKVRILGEKYSGESVRSKLERLRRKMAEEDAEAHVLTLLDAIAWLLNIRGSDVEFNPVAIAYAIVTRKKAMLFIDQSKVSVDVRKALAPDVRILDYEDFSPHLSRLGKQKQRVWLDEASVSLWVAKKLGRGAQLILKPSPIAFFKAVKNETEIAGARAAHVRDGIAMAKFLCWLEQAVPQGGVTELSAATKMEQVRGEQDLFQGLSFVTISSYGRHGAIVHYAVSPETDIRLQPEGIYLIDSGSQYLDATTDITRTVCLGEPTDEQRDRFTRVLKGLIALLRLSFPQGAAGPQIDALARLALWEKGLNYGHGTGHGIGAYLNVHEGPQSISPTRGFGIPLEPGMINSIEPAYYKDNDYGLRWRTWPLSSGMRPGQARRFRF